MQSALNTNTESLALVSATAMKEMTVTKESIYQRQRVNVLESLMESMVKAASERGDTSFSANLNPQFGDDLLTDVTSELTKLGYTVNTEVRDNPELGSFKVLTISWA